MTTTAELKSWYARNYPGRDWNGWCQAAVVNAADATGGFVRTYPTATDAYNASSIASSDYNAAPLGAIHYFSIPGLYDGHVGVSLGGGLMLHGYTLIHEAWGTNLGTIPVGTLLSARPSWGYRGWSYTNGVNKVHLEESLPPVPAGAKRFWNADSDVAIMRSGPGRSYERTGEVAGNDYGDFNAWTRGENVNGNNIWIRGHYSGNWAWVGSFKDQSVTGLPEIPSSTPVEPAPPTATYKPADLSWIVEPTASDFPAWIRYEEHLDTDSSGDYLKKNEEDWNYYLDKYKVDQPYEPRESIVHWWDAPGAGATFEGVLNHFLNTRDKSVGYITEPGRIAKTGSMFTASYTTGQAGMFSWSSENNPLMTTDSPDAELGYRTLAYLHYVIEKKNPKLRAQPIKLHKDYMATQCSDIDPVRLRDTIEKFFDGRLDPATGEEPAAPAPEPEQPVTPVPEKPDVDLPDTTVVSNLVNEAASNVIVSAKVRGYLWWGILFIGVVLLGIQGWFAGVKEIPPEWFYGTLGVSIVVLPVMALIARANLNKDDK